MSWYCDVQGDGSFLFLAEELILKESGHVIVDGDLYLHWDTRCHRAISKLSQSLGKCNSSTHNYPVCAHAQQGVKQSVCLSSISIKIGKSQHLSKSRVNKWDKMV